MVLVVNGCLGHLVHTVPLFDDLLSLAQSMQTCFPHILSFSSGWSWLAMDVSNTSATLTSSDPDEHDRHIICYPMLEHLCHAHGGVFMEALFDEEDLGRIARSCHFAMDILCDKE